MISALLSPLIAITSQQPSLQYALVGAQVTSIVIAATALKRSRHNAQKNIDK
jgi:hypothetical protein